MHTRTSLPAIVRLAIVAGLAIAAAAWPSTPLRAAVPDRQADDPSPPATPVKLIFIHHSTGGNWLADPNPDQPSGGLGIALRDNNYFVSATNYGWGPDGIGDRTDIPNWPEWFSGPQSSTYLDALYNESGQNVSDFGRWSRMASDPGGENEIVMFKSCFPNSDLYGDPGDPPAAEPDDQFTVSNARAVYNALLTFFQTRQDRLFVVITAPPMAQGEYGPGDPSPARRAANARALNNWLVNEWLAGYPYHNVAVFDYYNVLTSNGSARRTDDTGTNEEPHDAAAPDGNHHRWWDGQVQHIQTVDNNFSAYPSDSNGDSHPTTAGHQKATAEFVPLLNVWYHRWKAGAAAPRPTPTATPEEAAQLTPTPEPSPTPAPEEAEQPTPVSPPPAQAGVIDDFEAGDQEWSSNAETGSTVQCGPDTGMAHHGSASLRIDYDIQQSGWVDCGRHFVQDWSSGSGLSLWIRSQEGEQPITLMIFSGDPGGPTPFEAYLTCTPEWTQAILPWAGFARAPWADERGLRQVDPARMTGYAFSIGAEGADAKGTLWIDDVALLSGDVPQAAPTATAEPTETPGPAGAPTPEPTATATPVQEEAPKLFGRSCPFSALLLPLGAIAFVLRRRQRTCEREALR